MKMWSEVKARFTDVLFKVKIFFNNGDLIDLKRNSSVEPI